MTVSAHTLRGSAVTSALIRSSSRPSNCDALAAAVARASASRSTPVCDKAHTLSRVRAEEPSREHIRQTHHVACAQESCSDGEHSATAAKVDHGSPLNITVPSRRVQHAGSQVRPRRVLLKRNLRRLERFHVLKKRLELAQLHTVLRASRQLTATVVLNKDNEGTVFDSWALAQRYGRPSRILRFTHSVK